MIFRKNYHLYHKIYKKVTNLIETGLIGYWKGQAIGYYLKTEANENKFPDLQRSLESSNYNKSITYKDLQPACIMLCYGQVLGIIAFVTELGWYHTRVYRNYIQKMISRKTPRLY